MLHLTGYDVNSLIAYCATAVFLEINYSLSLLHEYSDIYYLLHMEYAKSY